MSNGVPERGAAAEEGLSATVECLSDGGFVVELLRGGKRYIVGETTLCVETGEVSAIVDGRRYTVDTVVESWGAVGVQGEVTLWCRHGPIEGDAEDRHRYAREKTMRKAES